MSIRNSPKRLQLGLVAAAMVLGVVGAMPSSAAPEKIFGLQVPTSVNAGETGVEFKLTFRNETPTGNSSINSLTATVTPPEVVEITNATAPSGSVSWTDSDVSVSNMSPVKNGKRFVVTLTLGVASATSCSPPSVNWSAMAWTGSSFSGDSFRLLTTEISPGTGQPYSQLVTQVSAACQLRFVEGGTPASAIQGTPITSSNGPVQVELIQDGSRAAWFDGTVDIIADTTPSEATLSGNSVLASGGLASFPALSADTVGDYTVYASASTLDLTSDHASFSIYADGIFCGDPPVTASGGGTTIDLTRTDTAEECQEIPYTLTVTRKTITLLKDEALVRSQGAQFEVTITWADPVGEYPDFGTTQFDIDGDDGPIPAFVPLNCRVLEGVPQYPVNPNESGAYYPASGTVQPWCVSAVDIHPEGDIMVATETFLGSGDPKIFR